MEIRGIRPLKISGQKNLELFELRPPEYFSVPIVADDGNTASRAVNVGEKVKEGSVIAKPNGKYGTFVYSPVCGKVVNVVKKLNASGALCEHVVIARDLVDEKEYFRPLIDFEIDQDNLLKRLYESGMIDNVEPFDPAYKKYLLRNPINELVINCAPFDPYAKSSDALLLNFSQEVFEGARLLQRVACAKTLVFIFTVKQKKLARLISSKIQEQKIDDAKIKFYPNVYPLQYDRLIAYYRTGKMVAEGTRTAEVQVIVDTVNNCYDFYNAVKYGKPAIDRAVTVGGNNCLRRANYFIKNGTPISHILDVVGTKPEANERMLIYGGIMTGVAQESAEVSVTLTASTILFCDTSEYIAENYMPCLNCGKCNDVCPVKLNVQRIDKCFMAQDFESARKMHVETCLGCGCCSHVCPSRRNLSQRIKYVKDYVQGKRAKEPNSAEYVESKTQVGGDAFMKKGAKFEDVSDVKEKSVFEEMTNLSDLSKKTGGKKDA